MSALYNAFVRQAADVINKYGDTVTWNNTNDNNATNTSYTPKIVFKTGSASNAFQRLAAASNIVIGNADAIMAVQSFVPTIADSLVRQDMPGGPVSYTLKSLNPVMPGDTLILWALEFND